jgi:hypothetical protein
MFNESHNSEGLNFLNKKQLANLKTKALRSGVWFKVLQKIDRVLFDLTIKIVDNVRSSQLAKSILELTMRLENGMKSSFARSWVKIGLPIAQKISSIAQKLGNLSANSWLLDSSFIRFLAVLHFNDIRVG